MSQGEVSEQTLYDETTSYLRFVYNNAKMLNRSAARLAMSVFQRRLASSTWALSRSFERRIAKLDKFINDIEAGHITIEQLITMQRRMNDEDIFDTKTADDERSPVDGGEENEQSEDRLLRGVVAASLADLIAERDQVSSLRDLAKRVYDKGIESKFEKLHEQLISERFAHEKLIIFTEHRDTLEFLVRRLNGLGYTGQVAQIHGGMHYTEREDEVERFRKAASEGGARFLVCTDAAGEGINLQFCWAMINYDVPWNPARLEQRMGRIHRYGQQHDPVVILNLVAPDTREGKVLETLLQKLERIRKELGSDKVYDVVGRLLQGVSIKQYMERVATADNPQSVAEELGGAFTKEQVEALAARERALYGDGGEVKRDLPRLRVAMDNEIYRRLIPGFVRHYIEKAAPLVAVAVDGDLGGYFALRPMSQAASAKLLPELETYPLRLHDRLSVSRPPSKSDGIWVHPGEPVFEQLRTLVLEKLGSEALRGAVFVDPEAERPYLFHLALISVVREADPTIEELATARALGPAASVGSAGPLPVGSLRPAKSDRLLECRLVGVKQFEGSDLEVCSVERLLLLKGGAGLPPAAQRLALAASDIRDQAAAFIAERVARQMAIDRKNSLLATVAERESFLQRGFSFQEADLAAARAKQSEKVRTGNKAAVTELERIKQAQRELAGRRERAIATIRREPELIAFGPVQFLAHALVVPSSDPLDREQHDTKVEHLAMQIAREWEESEGATVLDVHTPELARAAGLPDYPGFDLLSQRPNGQTAWH